MGHVADVVKDPVHLIAGTGDEPIERHSRVSEDVSHSYLRDPLSTITNAVGGHLIGYVSSPRYFRSHEHPAAPPQARSDPKTDVDADERSDPMANGDLSFFGQAGHH